MVHGDLRAPNVHLDSGGKLIVYDFDWAGKTGEVMYPDVLNPTERWALGAEVGARITTKHEKQQQQTVQGMQIFDLVCFEAGTIETQPKLEYTIPYHSKA